MKLTLLSLIAYLTLSAFYTFSQDTTAFNLIGLNRNQGGLDFFDDDSTSMGSINIDFAPGYGFAIFQDPSSGKLYSILQDTGPEDRNLFVLNPLTGVSTLEKDLVSEYINSADLGPDGIIYFSVGNGNAVPNTLHKYSIVNETESFLSTPIMSGSRALEFNPTDSSLYLYEGYDDISGLYTDRLYVYNLLTNTADTLVTTGMSEEIHGAFYDEETDKFFVSAYGGKMFTTDNTYLNGTAYHNMVSGVTSNDIMDMTKVKYLEGADTRTFCPSDSVQIKGYFGGVNYKWFVDGIEIPGITDSTVYAKTAGVYRALMEVTMNEQVNYLWSREITVNQATKPSVNISATGNDTEICPGDTIVLNGANGGTLQWYKDGVAIAGANANKYNATAVGSYNQMKTNMSGCSDTAAVAIVITADQNCTSNLAIESEKTFYMYPNPTFGQITVVSPFAELTAYTVIDLTGKTLIKGEFSLGTNAINLKTLNAGVYLLTMNGITKRIVKR